MLGVAEVGRVGELQRRGALSIGIEGADQGVLGVVQRGLAGDDVLLGLGHLGFGGGDVERARWCRPSTGCCCRSTSFCANCRAIWKFSRFLWA